jgi:RND family efflux transporter MFP subunit
MHVLLVISSCLGLTLASVALAAPAPQHTYLVGMSQVSDEKSVFATVQSAYVVPARARIGGTILELKVRQGDRVEQGQVIATVGDPKLALQINSYAAQVRAAEAQAAQAKVERDRAQHLVTQGAISRNNFDQSRTAYDVALSNLNSIRAQRAVIQQQVTEGNILAPASGRVITVPVTAGTVVMNGEAVATVARQDFVLRLEVPERHARNLKAGDPVRLDGAASGSASDMRLGTITLVYPQIDNGHVVADAAVAGLSDYFVGERVPVWVGTGTRQAVIVPAHLLVTHSGIDYARLWRADGPALDVPVQRGQSRPTKAIGDGIEILSGLKPGDRLLAR